MKKKPLFYIIYFSILGLCVIALIIGLLMLRSWLADYEASQPKCVADEVFDKYFKNPDLDILSAECPECLPKFETHDTVAAAFAEMIAAGDIKYSSAVSDNTVKKYIVKSGDTKFASFSLEMSGEKSKYGNDIYKLTEVELYFGFKKAITVMIPQGSTLSINGITADNSYVTESGITRDVEMKIDDDIPTVQVSEAYDTYVIGGLNAEPQVTVVCADGRELGVKYDTEQSCYCSQSGIRPIFSDELAAQYTDMIKDFATKYAAFTQNDGRFTSFSKYLDQSSELYGNIKSMANYWVLDHNGYDFEDVNVRNFYQYADGTISCRISFTHVLHMKGKDDFRDFFDTTYFMRSVNGQYLVYASQAHV